MGLKDCIRASDDASKLPLHGAALRTARAIGSNAGAGTGPVRGGLPSRGKKVVLGGSAKASSVEDAQKLLQKSKPKAHSRGGVGSKKRVRFEIRADAERHEPGCAKRFSWRAPPRSVDNGRPSQIRAIFLLFRNTNRPTID